MEKYSLIYDEPAKIWEEALPIGNGRLGAMIYGGLDVERIQINEDSVWSGYLKSDDKINSKEDFDKVRSLIKEEEYVEAKNYIDKNMLGTWTESYLSLGNVYIKFTNSGMIDNYRRELSLNDAVCSIKYGYNEAQFGENRIEFKREAFVSKCENVIVYKIGASQKGLIDLTVFADSDIRHDYFVESDTLIIKGKCPSHVEPSYVPCEYPVEYDETKETIQFCYTVKVCQNGGRIIQHKNKLEILNSSEVIFYITAETSFVSFDKPPIVNYCLEQKCKETIYKAVNKSYNELLTNHFNDYRNYFNRVDVKINNEDCLDNLTVERLNNVKNGGKDNYLSALLYQYGRYLLISCSREGTQPANLQGIWNHNLRPVWSSNLTTNINAQMNYWLAETSNLSELHTTLIDAIMEMSISGEKTAKDYFNSKGFAVCHNVDIWRKTTPVGISATFAFWPMASGWLCGHLWEHFQFGNNLTFLKDTALPIMKKAAEFYLDFMIEDDFGYLVTSPSVSPENEFLTEDGGKSSVAYGSTMDMSIIRELFNNIITAGLILSDEDNIIIRVKEAYPKLLPFKVGGKGQLLEWCKDFDEVEPGHRHISHLYGLYPGNQIVLGENNELVEAAKTTLRLRLENGGGHTGWSCAWIISMFARLQDKDNANKYIQMLLKKSTFDNLFDAHPPFQIDGNLGYSAGFVEMLLQSHFKDNAIMFLPALPNDWKSGFIKGIKARGSFIVDIYWDKNKLSYAKIKSNNGNKCFILSNENLKISLDGKEVITTLQGNVISFQTETDKEYFVSI